MGLYKNIYLNRIMFDDILDFIPRDTLKLSKWDHRVHECDDITVSVSGGVDSMVCLHRMSNVHKVHAVHINYGNRDTSDREAEFVEWFCGILGVPLYTKTIQSLRRRRDFTREGYERDTRNMRFDAYRHLGFPVVLGHNRDDCLENILSNIKKQRSLHNLKGMCSAHTENGVEVLRPFLDEPKSSLVEYARENNIPYLYDSTPNWCERGRLRDVLIPSLRSFDPRLLSGLLRIADVLSHNSTILSKHVYPQPKWSKKALSVRIDENIDSHVYYEMIVELCRRNNERYPSHRSVVQALKQHEGKSCWINDSIRSKVQNGTLLVWIF